MTSPPEKPSGSGFVECVLRIGISQRSHSHGSASGMEIGVLDRRPT
jgi:hypothetical protein